MPYFSALVFQHSFHTCTWMGIWSWRSHVKSFKKLCMLWKASYTLTQFLCVIFINKVSWRQCGTVFNHLFSRALKAEWNGTLLHCLGGK